MSWRTATFAVWAFLAASALVLAAFTFLGRRGVGSQPLVSVRRFLAIHPVVRVLAVLGWMWMGWHLFAR